MAATTENPIIFYDIFSNDGPWSANTFKTRLNLNYKRLPYRVEYVSIADIEPKLKGLGIPPGSFNPVFKYTLPMIADPSSDPTRPPTYIVDSFEIAVYLDDKYPAPRYPIVLPPGTRALQKIAADQVMSTAMSLAPLIIPYPGLRPGFLDERGLEYFIRTRTAMVKMNLSEFLGLADKFWGPAQAKWEELGNSLDLTKGQFVMGDQISFVDFVIGGFIHGTQKMEGGEMTVWKRMAAWQDGKWARIWNEIAKLEAESSELVEHQ